MKVCTNCILPETFPGIRFTDDGVCNHCHNFNGKKTKIAGDKERYEKKFYELLDKLNQADQYDIRSYDILMAYSGGKDSTYTMSLLKTKYKLRVLAVSFDNGFISKTAMANINAVTEKLDIDHVLFKPEWSILKKIFSMAAEDELYSNKTLERASTICTSCIGLVKSLCLKMAIEQNIPMIGFGWSPGQAPTQSSIMKNNPSLTRISQQAILTPLKKVVGENVNKYFLNEANYKVADKFPYNVHPMAWEFYNEEMIINEIEKLGWRVPADTDTNSSNCLLNALANVIHLQKYGFHPYVWEIANMVREGIISREEGYKKIYSSQSQDLVNFAREKLGL